MNIIALGPFSWCLISQDTALLINPNLDTLVPTPFDSRGFYNYRGMECHLDIEIFLKDREVFVLQLSDQFQYYSIKHSLKFSKYGSVIVPVNSTIPLTNKIKTKTMAFKEKVFLGNFEVILENCKLGDVFWDNSGTSVSIKSKYDGESVFIQGGNSLHGSYTSNSSYSLTILTWNKFSNVNSISSYKNEYDDQDNITRNVDASSFLSYFEKAPLSRNIAFQGNDFSSSDGENMLKEPITCFSDFIKPYMIGCNVIDLTPGSILNLSNGSLDKLEVTPIERNSYSEVSLFSYDSNIESDERWINEFLDNLSKIVLLTSFGKEMFGTSSIGNSSLGSSRLLFVVSDKDKNWFFKFDISKNKFIPTEKLEKIEQLTTYPYGMRISKTGLLAALKGEVSLWQLVNSSLLEQWYMGVEKNAPVSMLYSYFQEPCMMSDNKTI